MNNEIINELASLLSGSFKGVKNPTVRSVMNMDLEEVAYKTILLLEDGFGKEAPIQDRKRHKYWYHLKPMTNVACDLGRLVLIGREDPEQEMKKRNLNRFKVGYHILNALADNNLIEFRKGEEKRDKYRIRVVKGMNDTMELILELADSGEVNIPVYTRPQFEEPIPFTRFYHPEAGVMVRNTNKDANQYFTTDICPKTFEVINKHMEVAYRINTDLLNIYRECAEDDLFTFANKDLDEEQLKGLERERDKVLEIAEMVGERKFWEYMFYDNRSRLYSSSVYLSHAGCKLSKSLYLYDERKPIGAEGYFWMLVHASNCFGYDKDSIEKRYEFADSNLDEWLTWGKDPVNNKGWQKADSPFEFLAAINEIHKAYNNPGGVYAYESGLPTAWDASCSGLQVLSALAKDRESGALCNLTQDNKRGDYYLMIADHVWKDCVYTPEDEKKFEEITKELKRLDRKVDLAFKADNKEKIINALNERKIYAQENKEDIINSSKVFWGRPEMVKLRRKICKRPCMTYFYSCGAKTMSKAMYRDHAADEEFKGLNSTYCFWLSKRIYTACQELMPVPTALMNLFIQMGIDDYNNKKDFEINAPFTNFKMIQNYRQDKTQSVFVMYKGKQIGPRVTVGKREIIDKNKVLSATSPNVVHMLDSQIVAAIVLKADYTVSCIHDSFSASPADAGKLYEDCRSSFVELFSTDVLMDLLAQKDSEHYYDSIKKGSLILEEVYENEHCFS